MTETERYQAARKQVRDQRDFWVHLAVFSAVNTGLVTLNLVKSPKKLWVHWVLMGWGAGLLLNGFQVFGGDFTQNWEARKIQELMKQDEAKEFSRSNSAVT
jgi:hypothetical protein